MRDAILRVKLIGVILALMTASAAAEQPPGDLSDYLPKDEEVSGWKLSDAPEKYRGDELFLMINGGAEIYNEYGFTQVLRAEYVNAAGKSINLEIYEMKSTASAYGIYTFKIGDNGEVLPIGQDALLQDYYLNFWKGNLLVTVIGRNSEEGTVRGIVALAKAVDARIGKRGERPKLADLLLREPLAFSRPKYVRGSLGVMDSYIFDTESIFRVREGIIGTIGDCQAFVFRYADEGESYDAFKNATTRLDKNPRFTNRTMQGNRCLMVAREKEFVEINKTGRHIAVVIGQNRDKVKSISWRLIEKLKSE